MDSPDEDGGRCLKIEAVKLIQAEAPGGHAAANAAPVPHAPDAALLPRPSSPLELVLADVKAAVHELGAGLEAPLHALLQPLVAEERNDVGPLRAAARPRNERARRVELGEGRDGVARAADSAGRSGPPRPSVLVAPPTLAHPRARLAPDLPAAHLPFVIGVVVTGGQAIEPDLGSVWVLHLVRMREGQRVGGVAEVDKGPLDLIGYGV